MYKMIEKLKDIIFGLKCGHCGERDLDKDSGMYNRAYNSLCQQATSDLGTWCNTCFCVNWEEPDYDKWINNQPTWIISHFDSYLSKRNDCTVHRDDIKPYAVFAISLKNGLIAATTRPYDTKSKIGLPGGKVDPGETPIQAVNRECKEEGWNIVIEEEILPFHYQYVGGRMIHWYLSGDEPTMLDEYKEKDAGIIPTLARVGELANSGYGNECLLKLKKEEMWIY
jgi:8-oxo-dGTP pyrophosphatase MutT (NUDIX family)